MSVINPVLIPQHFQKTVPHKKSFVITSFSWDKCLIHSAPQMRREGSKEYISLPVSEYAPFFIL